MFRHRRHGDDRSHEEEHAPASASEPAGAELPKRATVMSNDPMPSDPGRSVVRIQLQHQNGAMGEWSQEVVTLYQPPPDSPDGQQLLEWRTSQHLKHADRMPKIQLPLFAGCIVPVCPDPTDPGRLMIDEPALQQQAVHDYLHDQRSQQARQVRQAAEKEATVATGPPWNVPVECPNCGARVDQAIASKQADPRCAFCHEPLPVTPARS